MAKEAKEYVTDLTDDLITVDTIQQELGVGVTSAYDLMSILEDLEILPRGPDFRSPGVRKGKKTLRLTEGAIDRLSAKLEQVGLR